MEALYDQELATWWTRTTLAGTRLYPLVIHLIMCAFMAGFARTTEISLGVIKDAELRASFAKISRAIKIRILFFYPSIVRCSQVEGNRQLEKLHC
jgi:hypothetical protein